MAEPLEQKAHGFDLKRKAALKAGQGIVLFELPSEMRLIKEV